jgi:hypothetical protein
MERLKIFFSKIISGGNVSRVLLFFGVKNREGFLMLVYFALFFFLGFFFCLFLFSEGCL